MTGQRGNGADATEISGIRASVDLATEDGRAFSQARISLFGKWLFIVTASFYFVANIPLDVLMGEQDLDWLEEWFGFKERMTLGVAWVAATMWLSTRGKARSPQLLKWIDMLGTVAASALIAGMLREGAIVLPMMFQYAMVVLACTNLVAVRAIVIPSSVMRTALVSIGSFAPAIALIALPIYEASGITSVRATHTIVAVLMWSAIAIASAALTSGILFRLRRQVSEAAQLGHYILGQEIGRGGMGVVHKAKHATLRRPTAIKLLSPDRNQEADLRRFEREVQCTADLTHPNTIAIYDYGRTPTGIFYCAMEFIDGVTLHQLVDQWGPQSPSRVVQILAQVCGALAEAHHEGLIHRDVKPANIMLCERGLVADVAKVLDFGLVKETTPHNEDPAASTVGVVVGTPAYLSPEAIEDPASVDSRSDLYALGAVGYFLLTGTAVFQGESTVSICVKHLNEVPESPSKRLGSPVPEDLEKVLLSCLEKSPEDRPQSAEQLRTALNGCGCVGQWTTRDAASWWTENRAKVASPPKDTVGQTLAIDLDDRSPLATMR